MQRASATSVTEVLVHKKMFKLQGMQQGMVWDFLFDHCCRYEFFSASFSTSKSLRFWTFLWGWASHKAVFKMKYIQFLSNSLFYVIPSQVFILRNPRLSEVLMGDFLHAFLNHTQISATYFLESKMDFNLSSPLHTFFSHHYLWYHPSKKLGTKPTELLW